SSKTINRAIINIGGIANITFLNNNHDTLGFDTGPGNILLDSWIQHTLNKKYDHEGQWARSGKVTPSLLARLLNHPYLQQAPPKSTGREDFNLAYVQSCIDTSNLNTADIQATLLEFTAQSITNAINKHPETVSEVFICGGGACNNQLMLRLKTLLYPRLLANTSQLGIPAEWVEAAAFAWLAKQTMKGQIGNLPSVTGANTPVILGAIYPGQP
ncbi:MAG: anhydro-N-acetylmuramic acid kinase, partial [Spongiibacteraceae bacterium]|nr:anhydro-N-acetylmuramic acid kinase [Spongiibacteraceae bacterium]